MSEMALPSPRRALRIAVLANRKHSVDVASDAPPDALAEYDAEETVEAILQALNSVGHSPFFLEADQTLLDTLRETQPDICFNIAEGLRGDSRESHVPALLEMLDIPYTGSGVLTHAISLDKAATKRIWRDCGLPTAPFQVFDRAGIALNSGLSYPLFVKPVREGSGMGIDPGSIVRSERELHDRVAWVIATYRQPALAEPFLPGREFTVGLVGNVLSQEHGGRGGFYDSRGYRVLPVLEIDTGKGAVQGIYNAQAKSYAIESESAPGYLCPADIPEDLETRLQELAVAAFEAVGGLDVGRVDFRMGTDEAPYLLEINTLPGLNPLVSDIVIASHAAGIAYETLIVAILDLARERYGM